MDDFKESLKDKLDNDEELSDSEKRGIYSSEVENYEMEKEWQVENGY